MINDVERHDPFRDFFSKKSSYDEIMHPHPVRATNKETKPKENDEENMNTKEKP